MTAAVAAQRVARGHPTHTAVAYWCVGVRVDTDFTVLRGTVYISQFADVNTVVDSIKLRASTPETQSVASTFSRITRRSRKVIQRDVGMDRSAKVLKKDSWDFH